VLVRKALGRLIAAPLFTLFAVLSVAGGVAVTTAVYSVADALFLSDLGVSEPQTLAFVTSGGGGRFRRAGVSDEDFATLRDSQQSLTAVSASWAFAAPVASSRNAEMMPLEAVDGAYFSTLGVQARLGSVLRTSDDATRARVAVIGDELWKSRYAADPAIIGRVVRIAGQPFDIIGVMPSRYTGLAGRMPVTMVWIPLGAEALLRNSVPTEPPADDRGRLVVMGRLKSGSSIASASSELEMRALQLDAARPIVGPLSQPKPRGWHAASAADRIDETEANRRLGVILVSLVALVLVVACTNLANLVLARGTARQGELAIRMAMGASRGRLIWEQCVESLLLSAFGAVAAYAMFIVVSAMMTQDFTILLPPMGRLTLSIRPELNPSALFVAGVSLLLSMVVFGLEPAVHLARTLDIRSALASGASGIRPRVGRQRVIIRWQVAIAAGFFIVATMFIRATFEQARHDAGVDLDRIAVAQLNFSTLGWDESKIRRTVDRILEESRREAGLEAVSASTGLPFGIQPSIQLAIAPPTGDVAGALSRSRVPAIAATSSVFKTLGVMIVSGRGFNDGDVAAASPVVMLSERAARQLFGTSNAVGQSVAVKYEGRQLSAAVVGVTRDTDVRRLAGPPGPLVFLPWSQAFNRSVVIAMRSTGGGADAVAALRESIRRADIDVGVDAIGDGRALLSGPFAIARSAGRGTLYLGGFTLLLSMVGLFGVQSHVVTYRTREFGVRMSLGATAGQIKLMVMRDGYRPIVEGLVLGLWGGLAVRLIIRSYTDIDVAIFDSAMLLVAPIPVVLAAVAACYLPAARASRIDPLKALRCE